MINETTRETGLARLRAGQNALAEGRTERAAEALTEAESIFRQLDDKEHAADAQAALGEVQRQNGALDRAVASYEGALTLYKEANQPAREAAATLALGHIERSRG